jgi:hypothetical protein
MRLLISLLSISSLDNFCVNRNLSLYHYIYRLRKAQRLRDEVALGQGKEIAERIWPSIQTDSLKLIAEKADLAISVKITDPLIPISWYTDITEKSTVAGKVTTAHRLLVSERDKQINKYNTELSAIVQAVLAYCHLLSDQVLYCMYCTVVYCVRTILYELIDFACVTVIAENISFML